MPNNSSEPVPASFALWALGFRPFFLAGALHAAVLILVWLLGLRGILPLPTYFDPITWHAHEMMFGFTGAIIAGFVLTASQTWAGERGVHGGRLQLLFFTWLIARVLAILGGSGSVMMMFALFDLAFWPILAWYLRPYLLKSGQERNRVFFLFFGLFALSNLVLHAEAIGWIAGWSRAAIMTALYTILLVIGLIGGRVIPFFTGRAAPGATPVSRPLLEKATHALTALFAISAIAAELSFMTAALGAAAGAAHLARWLGWQPWKTWSVPILFILHVGYVWLPIGFFMKAFAAMGYIAPTLATHALSVGALGIVVYAMITRVSLGHTGRVIRSSLLINVCYGLIVLATFARSLAPAVFPAQTSLWLDLSGGFWILVYLAFVAQYGRWLLVPRPDGKPG